MCFTPMQAELAAYRPLAVGEGRGWCGHNGNITPKLSDVPLYHPIAALVKIKKKPNGHV